MLLEWHANSPLAEFGLETTVTPAKRHLWDEPDCDGKFDQHDLALSEISEGLAGEGALDEELCALLSVGASNFK